MAMRVTQRSGRIGSAKHNDRSFLDDKNVIAEHIDQSKSDNNIFIINKKNENDTFEDMERKFYSSRYGEAQKLRNERYVKEGHADRCKSTDDLYHGRLTRPEELILQVGNINETITPEELKKLTTEYLKEFKSWNDTHGNHGHILNVAMHFDESTPHVHIRRVWDYEKNGVVELGQNKALELAGVPLPDPNKPNGRYNNRKMTLDAQFRGIWQDICIKNGYDIETEPRPSKKHKNKADYISQQMDDEIKEKERQKEVLNGSINALKSEKAILSSTQVKEIEKKAKTTPFSKDKVILDKNEFNELVNTAAFVDKAEESSRKIDKMKIKAEKDARQIVNRAKSKAENLEELLASAELSKIRKENPELFDKNGNYISVHKKVRTERESETR